MLWLDARHHRFLAEAGTMNLFVIHEGRMLTPPLDGTLLAGITRDSLLRLQRESGAEVHEVPIALEDLLDWQERGEALEFFGAGTAARIAPIAEIAWSAGVVRSNAQAITQGLSQQLAQIQDGVVADLWGWRQPLGF